ncbi:MAG: protein kinase [Nannocystaceae bacterium]|nr:protein kinase [Nannocystaceae bacterium]
MPGRTKQTTRLDDEIGVGTPEFVGPADTDTVFLDDEGGLAEADEPVDPQVFKWRRPVSLRPGALIPGTRYRLVRWLGDGGMGTVFEAIQEDLDRRVALKVLRNTLSPVVAKLFRGEAKVLGRLESRFIVDVYDLVELSDGRLMIAMELLKGETLRKAIEAAGTLGVERLVVVARQICKGLGAAHRAGIVHRDVKPENISLEVAEGRGDTVKLLDFGIAQVGDAGKSEASRAGTSGYLAPEIISGLGGDARSDVYALGCTLYECVTGHRPFEDSDPANVLLAQLSASPVPPSTVCECPVPLERVILRCLEKDPGDRYADTAAVEAALCEVQISLAFTTQWDDLALPDVDTEVQERLRRNMPTPQRMRSRRWVPWVIAGAVLLGAGGVGVGYALRSNAESLAPDDEERLVASARAAAARAFFVYPPPEDTSVTTALGFVLELEALEGESERTGLQRATALRAEFADTLERLGDEYWSEEGGKPFALDYYAEALVFDAERTRARSRAAMTPGEFRLLRSKAERRTFTHDELTRAEPLIALSDVSPGERAARLESIERSSPRPSERRRQLHRLAQARRGAATAKPPPSLEPEGTAITSLARTPADVGASVEEVELPYEADSERARGLTKSANAAHATGDSRRAERLYADALAADRGHAAAHRGLGRIAFDRGSYALAARRLKKAVRLAPRRAAYRIALGDALYKSFDYEGAYAAYSRADALGSSLAAGRLAKVAGKRK